MGYFIPTKYPGDDLNPARKGSGQKFIESAIQLMNYYKLSNLFKLGQPSDYSGNCVSYTSMQQIYLGEIRETLPQRIIDTT